MLKIYTSADPSTAVSYGGDFGNPIAITFDGVNGGKIERKLYLRNDEITKLYDTITIQPQDDPESETEITTDVNGYSWKLYVGDQRPLEEQWDMIRPAHTINLSDLSNTTTYLPFWLRITVPAGAPAVSFRSASLLISCNEETA